MPDNPPPRMTSTDDLHVRTEYEWADGSHANNHAVLRPALDMVLGPANERSLIDLGCGNGSLTSVLASRGFRVVGLDAASTGIMHARSAQPDLDFRVHDMELPLPPELTQAFDVVLSAEVIEHLFLPRVLFDRATEALAPGGRLVITTPYHGYLKNLALAVTNSFDVHWNPNWDYGHVKFFSRRTLSQAGAKAGYELESFHRVGRIPPLAMSMVAVFRKSS